MTTGRESPVTLENSYFDMLWKYPLTVFWDKGPRNAINSELMGGNIHNLHMHMHVYTQRMIVKRGKILTLRKLDEGVPSTIVETLL